MQKEVSTIKNKENIDNQELIRKNKKLLTGKDREDEILNQMQKYSLKYKPESKNAVLFSAIKIIIGIVLLGLIFFYSDALSDAFFVFSGHEESTLINSNYTMTYKDYTIKFTTEIYKNILAIHSSANGKEIKICLLGSIENKTYFVTALYIPEILSQTAVSVESQMCDQNTIISFHSHPVESCLFSQQDITSYEQFKAQNPDGMIGVMCTNTRFAFYRE